MNHKKIRLLVHSAMWCALVFAATWFVIPTPLIGNVNLGDCMILVGSVAIGGPWAILACSLGAALCDIVSGYTIYAPATLLIKAGMVLIVLLFHKLSQKKFTFCLSAVCAELWMILGYFLYEALVLSYGFAALANVPFNAIQGTVCTVLAVLVLQLLHKSGILKNM